MEVKSSYINQYFDQVYVLNLESRPDRKIAMLQQLNRLGIKAEFVQAINGYSYQNKIEHQNYLEKPIGGIGAHHLEFTQQKKMIKSPGAWGYLKTYYGILKDAQKRGFERILCFDDDVLFHKDFEKKFCSAIGKIPEDWKLLYLGASQYLWKSPQGLTYPDPKGEEQPFYFPNNTDGSFALGLDVSVFDILLDDILRMNCPFDSGPLRTVNRRYPQSCFVLDPNLVIADVSDSDIREGQEQQKLAEELKWKMQDYIFPIPMDLVSVIIPAYNAEKTIEKAIRSILMQSYPTIEVIVVDDASSDGTVQIVNKLISEDSRIRLIPLPENKGVGGARNEGLKASKGRIIAFQDADDISLKNRLAYQLVPIYEKGMLFSVCRFYRSRCTIDELDLEDQEATLSLVESRRMQNNEGLYAYRDRAEVGLVTSVYRRKVFENFGLFEEHRFGEDMEFLERVLFYKLHKTFNDSYNGHSFLSETEQIANIFKRIEKPLYLSPEMDENNLTSQFEKKSKDKRQIEQQFREKYRTGALGQYLPLSPIENGTERVSIKYNTLILDALVILPEVEHQMVLAWFEKRKEEGKLNPSVEKIYKSLSWKITAPLRWVGDVVKRFTQIFR